MTQPLVTIVTPAFNQARFLTETIESVLAQTYPFIEYVVINDGSTDETAEVMARYGDRILAVHQQNLGQSRTINRGLVMANGEYFGYLSSDDVLDPEAVATLVKVLERDKTVVCAYPNSNLIDQDSAVIKRDVCRPFDLAALVIRQECYIGPGALYRTKAARQVGDWRSDLRLAPDREFWMRLSSQGGFHFLPRSLAGYRTHLGSTSYAEVSEEASREYLTVLDNYFSQSDVDPAVIEMKDQAYGYANFVISRNCFRAGRFATAMRYYKEAIGLHPPLASFGNHVLLLRTVVSKPIRAMMSRLKAMVRQ